MDSSAKSIPDGKNASTDAESSPTSLEQTGTEPTGTPKKAKKDRHLYQIDFVRLVTFAGVVLDHVILAMATSADIIAQGIGMMLRYTRYCFFALTGFVLTFQYRNRDLHAPTFWRRRYKLIGLPFVTWSLFYWVYNRYKGGGIDDLKAIVDSTASIRTALKSIAYDLITGHAAYHLYFLSVSMQIYLVFPAVLWVLKRTWGYHRYLLAASLVFHVWLLYHMVRPPLDFFTHGLQSVVWRYLAVTILPYQFFVLAGCLAAFHFEAFSAFMKRWRWPLLGVSVVSIIVTWVYYGFKVQWNNPVINWVASVIDTIFNTDPMHPGSPPEDVFRATNVFMVHNAFMFVGIIVILYIGGTVWQARRNPGSLADTLMSKAADRSFAIYLAHVLALSSIMPTIHAEAESIPLGWRILITYLLTCFTTLFLVEILRLSPISLITTGRNRLDWRKQNPAKQAGVAALVIVGGLLLRYLDQPHLGKLLIAASALLLVSAAVVAYKQFKDTDAPVAD
ncbi:MAG: acyltransferase [Gordonia sp. (in: high G+C Gram-positive bacteria)]